MQRVAGSLARTRSLAPLAHLKRGAFVRGLAAGQVSGGSGSPHRASVDREAEPPGRLETVPRDLDRAYESLTVCASRDSLPLAQPSLAVPTAGDHVLRLAPDRCLTGSFPRRIEGSGRVSGLENLDARGEVERRS